MRTPVNMQLFGAHEQAFTKTIACAQAYRDLRELLAEPEMEVLPEDLQAFYEEYIARRTVLLQAFAADVAAADELYRMTVRAVRDGQVAVCNPTKQQEAIAVPAAIGQQPIAVAPAAAPAQAAPAGQAATPFSFNLDGLPDENAKPAAEPKRKVYSQRWQEAVGIGEDILKALPDLPEAADDFAENVETRVADQVEWIKDNQRVTDKLLGSLERTAKGVERWMRGREDDD
jgi:hypothetical protein